MSMSNDVNGTETTATKQWLFAPGQSGNPLGRPKGSRNRLAEDFVADLRAVWSRRGSEVLEKLADKRPHELARLVAYTMPKEFVVKDQTVKELSDEQVSSMLEYLNDQMGKNAKLIDGEATDFESALPDKAR